MKKLLSFSALSQKFQVSLLSNANWSASLLWSPRFLSSDFRVKLTSMMSGNKKEPNFSKNSRPAWDNAQCNKLSMILSMKLDFHLHKGPMSRIWKSQRKSLKARMKISNSILTLTFTNGSMNCTKKSGPKKTQDVTLSKKPIGISPFKLSEISSPTAKISMMLRKSVS